MNKTTPIVRLYLVLLLCLLAATAAIGQEIVGRERGFKPGQAHDFSGFDSVNLFNGNLNLTIPLGQSYPVGAGLSYQFVLRYSGNVWIHSDWMKPFQAQEGRHAEDPSHCYFINGHQIVCNSQTQWYMDDGLQSDPSKSFWFPMREHAGMGWRLSFGELYPPSPNAIPPYPGSMWRYESPDGAEHSFYTTLHSPVCGPSTTNVDCDHAYPDVFYTRDGTYMRLRKREGSTNDRIVEFADGQRQLFTCDDQRGGCKLKYIYTQHTQLDANGVPVAGSPHVRFEYDDVDGNWWKVIDSHGRTHVVTITGAEYPINRAVRKVELAQFGTTAAATYDFTYHSTPATATEPALNELSEILRPCAEYNKAARVRLLKTLAFPNGEKWEFEYNRVREGTCDQSLGAITSATMPTGGRMEWKYKPYAMLDKDSNGVEQRTVVDRDNTILQVTKYSTPNQVTTVDTMDKDASGAWTRVVSRTKNYFRHDWHREYGLPYSLTSDEPAVAATHGPRNLSSITYDCRTDPNCGSDSIVRATYVSYEMDYILENAAEGCGVDFPCFRDRNRRSKGERVVFFDDPHPGGVRRYLDTARTNFDGLGNYREVKLTNNFEEPSTQKEARLTFTAFNGTREYAVDESNGSRVRKFYQMLAPTEPWVLHTYSDTYTKEGSEYSAAQTCFDSHTGFLNRIRKISGGLTPSDSDSASVFTPDSSGFVATEEHFGSTVKDANGALLHPLGISNICTERPTHNPFTYTLHHTYEHGVLKTSQYAGASFLSVNNSLIDKNTGLAEQTKDTAGLITTYGYDSVGRLRTMTPPSGPDAPAAPVTYNYQNATATAPARVVVTAGSGDNKTEQQYEFNGVGKLELEKRLMPDGKYSVRKTTYDFAGRNKTVSEWDTNKPSDGVTKFDDYDAFGRPGKVTAPDGNFTVFSYTGQRETKRTYKVATSETKENDVSVVEEFDALGRLYRITEDADGAKFKTQYGYRVGDQLSLVRLFAATCTGFNCADSQNRTFNYDGRGFLVSEDHPEAELTAYEYDARGHVRTKKVAGSVTLRFDYDKAERLEKVRDAGDRALKVFTYDSATLPSGQTVTEAGRLTKQEHNNHRENYTKLYAVRDFFEYDKAGRIKTKHTVVAEPNGTETKFKHDFQYNELGLPLKLTYPVCASCTGTAAADRPIDLSYRAGLLTEVKDITTPWSASVPSGITYTPAGQVHQVHHKTAAAATIVDTYAPDPNGMARPRDISFTGFCDTLRIDVHPIPKNVGMNQLVELTVQATGATSYQWYEGTTELAGETAATLRYTATATRSLWVQARNGTCTVDSRVALVRVTSPCDGLITTPPSNQRVQSGQRATFTIGVVSGATVEWFEGAHPSTAKPAATGTPFTTLPLTQNTNFWARVTSADGTCSQESSTVLAEVMACGTPVLTPSATTVLENQAFSLTTQNVQGATYTWFAGATQLGTTSTPSFGITAGITANTTYSVRVQDPVCHPAGTTSAAVTVNVCVAPLQQTIDVDRGTTTATLTIPAESGVTVEWFESSDYNDTSLPKGATTSISVPVTGKRTYWARMTRACGPISAVTRTAFVTIDADCKAELYVKPAPVALQLTGTATTPKTLSTTFTALAGPRGKFTYKWFLDGQEVASSSSYTWSYTDNGSLNFAQHKVRVEVATPCGPLGEEVTLTLIRDQAQRIGAYDPLTVIYGTYSAKLFVSMDPEPGPDHTYTYEWFMDDGTADGLKLSGSGKEINVRPTTVGLYWARVTGTHPRPGGGGTYTAVSVSKKMEVSQSNACALPPLRVTQDYFDLDSGPSSSVTFTALLEWRGVSFQWYQGVAGDTRVPVSSDRDKPHQLTVSTGSLRPYWVRAKLGCGGHVDSATLYFTRGGCVPVMLNPNLASFDVPYGGSAKIDVALNGGIGVSYTWYRLHPETQVGTGTSYTASNVTASGRYIVRAVSSCGSAYPGESFVSTVRVASCASLTPPAWKSDVWTNTGTATTLNAQTGGATSYQWYRGEVGDTTSPIAGQTQATFVTDVINADAKYWVRVSGAGCIVDSPTITVHPCDAPAPTRTIDYNTNISAGQATLLSVAMSGTNPTYQWYAGTKGNTSTPFGRQVDTIQVIPNETTRYWVRVTSNCGGPGTDRTWDSDTFTVSVCPRVTAQPTAAKPVVMPGTGTTVSLTASGVETYQWYIGQAGDKSKPVANSNSASIPTGNLTAATTFWCEIKSGNCPAWSDAVTVEICPSSTAYFNNVQTKVKPNHFQTMTLLGVPTDVATTWVWYKGALGDTSQPQVSQPTIGINPSVTTSYWVRVTFTDTGCYWQHAITIEVCVPTVTTHPQSQMITKGQAVTLTVAADIPGVTWEWFMGPSGNTGSGVVYTGPSVPVSPQSPTSYWARGTSSCGVQVNSNTANITICEPPAITHQPNDHTLQLNYNASLSVTATGSNLTYQWYRGLKGDVSTPLTGKTTPSIQFQATDTYDYWVRVTGTCGSVDSNSAKVSVPPKSITPPTGGGWIVSGTSKTLTVAATGNQLRYEWLKRVGATTTVIAGQTGTSLSTGPITTETAFIAKVWSGNYPVQTDEVLFRICAPPQLTWGNNIQTQVKPSFHQVLSVNGVTADMPHTTAWYEGTGANARLVSNQENLGISPSVTTTYWVRKTLTDTGCTTDSSAITINVCIPTITTHPAASTTINKVANPSASARLTVAADITVSYQWYIGQPGDTSQPISGATQNFYDASPNADTTYWVRVTGSCSQFANSTAAQVVLCKPPAISTQPVSVISSAGGQSQTLSVAASGTNVTYTWYRGTGSAATATGHTTASITVAPYETTDYWVRLNGMCGLLDSALAKVSVPPSITTHPVSQNVTSGQSRTLSVVASGTQLTYQWYQRNADGNATLLSGQTAASFATPNLTATATYFVKVMSGSPNAFVYSNDATVTVCAARTISVLNTYTGVSGSSTALYVTNEQAGDSYEWYRGNTGDTSAYLGVGNSIPIAPTETTNYWLRTKRSDCNADTATYTVRVCIPKITAQPTSKMIASGSSHRLQVSATGTGPLTYQWYRGAKGNIYDPVPGATAYYYDAAPAATTTYWVRVSSPSTGCYPTSSADSEAATVSVCKPPAISIQPLSQTASKTTTVQLDVTATGDGLTYQWYEKTPAGVVTAIPNATGRTVQVRPGDTRYYWARVTGTCGLVDSAIAKLSILPTIDQQPVDGVACGPGASATFSVSASGSEMTYQWYRQYGNNMPQLVGTTNPIQIPIASEPVYVWCTVKSGDAPVNTNTVSATIQPAPTITGVTVTGPYSGWYRLAAGYTNDEYFRLAYQWYEGTLGDTSRPIPGATWYYVDVSPATRPKTYWVRATFNDAPCHTDKQVTIP